MGRRLLRTCVILSVVLIPWFARAADTHFDGMWWRSQSRFEKNATIAGFYNGLLLGRDLVVRSLAEGDRDRATDAFARDHARYMTRANSIQLVNGLDAFYRNPRNRTITVDRAVWAVVNRLDGMADADLEALTEELRRAAISSR